MLQSIEDAVELNEPLAPDGFWVCNGERLLQKVTAKHNIRGIISHAD